MNLLKYPVRSKILKYADTHTLSSRKLRNLSAFGIYVSEVLTNILNRFPMERFQQIVSSALKKGLGSVNAAHRENVLLQSEFKRFSKLPETAARRALLQFDFEELLQDKFAKEYNFDAWCWAEDYDKATLTQILQNAKLDNPKVYARGCPREGVLLLAMMGAGEPLGKQAFDSFEFSVIY